MHCGGGLWYNVGMTARYPSSIREEELKNKVAADFFGAFAPIHSDSFDDTDHDTLLDYDEVYERGMDPFLVDSDGGGHGVDGVYGLLEGWYENV